MSTNLVVMPRREPMHPVERGYPGCQRAPVVRQPSGRWDPQYTVSKGFTTTFDSDSLTLEDEFTFDAHQAIIDLS